VTEKKLASLKQTIEEIIAECIEEIKNTQISETSDGGGVEGYSVPNAFEGGKKHLRRKRASLGNSIGYLPVPNWEELEGTADVSEETEESELKESKSITTSSKKAPEHQFRLMMKDARDKLVDVEKLVQTALKYKAKHNIHSDKMGVLAQKSINKISGRIYSLLTKFQGMKN